MPAAPSPGPGTSAADAATPLLAQAAALLGAGQPAEALPCLAEAARLRPGDAAILHDWGLASLACGHLAQALAALQAAIAARPRFAAAHLRLGIALERQGDAQAALAAYKRAAELDPALADARYRTGELLDNLGRPAEAARAFARAAAGAPASTLGRMAAARGRLAEGRDREAEAILRQLVAQAPGQAAALELLGQVLAESGRFEEAAGLLLRAIDQAPALSGAYYEVVRCRKIGAQDGALIARMRAAVALPELEAMSRARVHLALGKAADDLGHYPEAMGHCDAAQALRDPIMAYDQAAFVARVDRMMAPILPAPLARAGGGDPVPILIMGLPRSGTTLLEQMLSAHPAIGGAGELAFWNAYGPQWEAAPGGGFFARARGEYLRVLRAAAPKAGFVTDKMPLNFQWAGLIHATIPSAVIIHCRRAPIAAALSIHQTHFSPRMPMPTGGAALVDYIRAARRLCAHWRAVLPPARYIEVDYEDLVAAPAPALNRLLHACGLPWDDACLHPERNARVVRTASKWQARQPVHATAVARWRNYEPVLGALRPLLDGNVSDDESSSTAGFA